MVLTILLFLALLSVLVIAHEWGHFTAARKAGMIVEEFGIGFPPRLFSWKSSKGTVWSINLVPIGGFVRIQGENGENRSAPGSFSTKSFFARFAVLFAGVFMNLVTAAVLLSIGFAFGLPAVTEDGVDDNAIVSDEAINIIQVLPDSPAEQAGIIVGDKLISVDGETFTSGELARQSLAANPNGDAVDVVIERGGEEMTFKIIPIYLEEVGREGAGVGMVETGNVRYPWYYAPVKGVIATGILTGQIVSAFATLIAGLFEHDSQVVAQLSGPVGIAVLTGQVADLGWAHLVQFAAMLSINLAVLNAIPFPALDGGRILFLFIEAIRRKPLSERVEQAFHATGFILLIALVIFVTYRDIVKLF